MVDVSHHRNDRRARLQVFRRVFFFNNGLCHFGTDIFRLETELFGHDIDCFGIQTLVDGNHDSDTHASSDNLIDRDIHHSCQFVGRYKLRQLQHLAFRHFLIFQFLHTAGSHFTFLFTIFGSLALSFSRKARQCFFHLFCYILFTDLLLDNRFLKAFFTMTLLATALSVSFSLSRTSEMRSSHVVHIHFFFIDAIPFLLTSPSLSILSAFRQFCVLPANLLDDGFFHLFFLILTDFLFLFAFLTLFFFRFFLRSCGLVQRRQVYLTDDIDLCPQFRLTDLEDFVIL